MNLTVRKDPDITVQRIARAIEKVLLSDGWINGSKVYNRRNLKKIAEAMARKSADPARFVNQGFHNTSITECILRQELETNPAQVMELIASVATTGKAFVGAGKRGRLVTIENKSLTLDLESRLANDQMVDESGIRDAVGQLFDLLVTQAFWDSKADAALEKAFRFSYTQDQKPKPGTTGERLLKLDGKTNNLYEVAYEGSRITVGDALDVLTFFDDTNHGLIIHKSVAEDLDCLSVSDTSELVLAAQDYTSRTGKPPVLLVFAGLLPDVKTNASRGHDLHAVTAYCGEDEHFFVESRWGPSHDIHLLGLTPEVMLNTMTLPSVEACQPYDNLSPKMRVIDPAYPVQRSDRAPQLAEVQKEHERLNDIENRASTNPIMRRQERYFEELAQWEAKRAEHLAIFGDALPFNIPPPSPPSSSSSF